MFAPQKNGVQSPFKRSLTRKTLGVGNYQLNHEKKLLMRCCY